MDQDFINWLRDENENSQGTGLLLAPSIQPEKNTEENQTLSQPVESLENILQIPASDDQEEILIPSADTSIRDDDKQESLPPEFQDPDANISKAWQERAVGFELSLDEPPPEIWTRINESASDFYDDDDDDEIEYEQGTSLQGAAYIQKREHGKNFTERLQHTLQDRKKRAEQEREQEENRKPKHPYIIGAVKKCFALLITLGLVCLVLYSLQRFTPENMNERALKYFEQEDYESAMNLYQSAYNLYPDMLGFLTGLAESAEKLGHIQTAEAARDELQRLTQNDEQKEIPETESQDITEIEIKLPVKPLIVPVTFDEFLKEADKAFNEEMYNAAIIYFFRALELNSNDVRPYIGIAESYRAKEMYFDAKRIQNEAEKKFKHDITLQVIKKFLEGKK